MTDPQDPQVPSQVDDSNDANDPAEPGKEDKASIPASSKVDDGNANPTTEDKANIQVEVAKNNNDAEPTTKEDKASIPTNGNNKEDDDVAMQRDRYDEYSLRVKSAFVLKDRAPSLPPLRSDAVVVEEPEKKRKRKKKRPRDDRIIAADKVCLAIIRGDTCPFGDRCKFSHDLKAFLADRPPGLSQVEGGCPTYRLKGYCPYGAMCLLGESHMNVATGENMKMDPLPENPPPEVMNVMNKDVLIQLRKRKYMFKTKRYNEVGGKKKEENGQKGATSPEANNEVGGKKKEENGQEETTTTQEANNEAEKKKEENGQEETTTQEPSTSAPSMSPLPTTRKLIDFSNKVYVAPLTTVGNLPFRRIMKKFGADITCGEMALSTNLLQGQPSEWALLKRHHEEDIFGVQIAAGYPDQFARVSELIEAEMNVDFVDLNLGCPLDLVCDKGAGAALMRKEKQLKSTVELITNILSCPVTIKMRTGWDMSSPFAHDLVRKIQRWNNDLAGGGIGAVMVHGRSRLQRYSKEANWEYIQQVAESKDDALPRLPVIGNGDIFTYTDYETKVLSKPCLSSCAMLARGALIKPWLPTEIKERRHWDISSSERLDFLKEFVKFGLEHWGSDQQGVNNCRRFLLEWLSFLHRYVPVGLVEVLPQRMNQRLPQFLCGRDDMETLMLSPHSSDWIHISEMLLGPVPEGFQFEPKHKAKGYANNG
ncbi:hypothetical protein ACA910_017499 [Epithemia clementina (nom. ined.)]